MPFEEYNVFFCKTILLYKSSKFISYENVNAFLICAKLIGYCNVSNFGPITADRSAAISHYLSKANVKQT